MYLRSAAEAVRILHARILFRRVVGFADLAAAIQAAQIVRGGRVARIWPNLRDSFIEGRGASAQCV